MGSIKVAIVGVGNCAASLVQGVEFYKDADPKAVVPGLMHVQFGDYHVRDVEFFDVRILLLRFAPVVIQPALRPRDARIEGVIHQLDAVMDQPIPEPVHLYNPKDLRINRSSAVANARSMETVHALVTPLISGSSVLQI